MEKHSVIRILREENGQNCKLEFTFKLREDAEKFVETYNRKYGNQKMSWVVDSYVASKA